MAVLLERDAAVAAAEEQAEPSDVDTDDEAHEAAEYDAWQARELARVTRDREEREKSFREKEELERLRAMTDEEREEWDRTHPPPVSEAQQARDKAKWSLMQKYYHKGAFFQDAADDKFGTVGTFDIYKRDFGAATGEDKGYDRSLLPKAMQVRKGVFGRAGQVKWTHLSAEDTTRKKDDNWGQDPSMRDKRACPRRCLQRCVRGHATRLRFRFVSALRLTRPALRRGGAPGGRQPAAVKAATPDALSRAALARTPLLILLCRVIDALLHTVRPAPCPGPATLDASGRELRCQRVGI